jgi:hypothetical protein
MIVDQGWKVAGPAAQVVAGVTAALEKSNMTVVQSFALSGARATGSASCPCPHHDSTNCTCDYVVLSVYHQSDSRSPSASAQLVVHTYKGDTWITLVASTEGPDVSSDSGVDVQLLRAVASVLMQHPPPKGA